MLWLPACARARHCIVVLFPGNNTTIQCLARAQAGNPHNIGLPMVTFKRGTKRASYNAILSAV